MGLPDEETLAIRLRRIKKPSPAACNRNELYYLVMGQWPDVNPRLDAALGLPPGKPWSVPHGTPVEN